MNIFLNLCKSCLMISLKFVVNFPENLRNATLNPLIFSIKFIPFGVYHRIASEFHSKLSWVPFHKFPENLIGIIFSIQLLEDFHNKRRKNAIWLLIVCFNLKSRSSFHSISVLLAGDLLNPQNSFLNLPIECVRNLCKNLVD